ncbi:MULTISPECIES: phage holin [Lysinibacillus]|uniref:phage holin n=1 Tax=Lysinibacillus TaxID=400634 RepID=UPI0001DA55FC|nr:MULTISPECIES: phage holin [Lysinibacillus]EFI69495.1 holin [Lysinibacillus fusiformis ZC1]WHP42009.1 phage holin [Lysinibacillus boronitolerans]MBX8943225.1 phage holin [Lysinibacillus sp. K60]UNT57045.1 phage holin [Lysinibacillus capsici]UUV23094.1 phage holin [Lysinibacillus sp. FN11]
MKINWKVRLQHKQFWVSLIALLLVLANQIAGIFNVDITIYNAQITAISETVLSILGLLGIIIDPTTKGASDSEQALKYDEPKGDLK